ncbi:hypothetical protein ENSA5_58430 [Enhygromyxa salina]|uniref:Uncharacterized protein n=1 Tax=Enhygromyxa salina TaxID=215803 RepID=A0A2S9XE17_9BACT|nr:hypothetical protein ENSA5_58430 [Enhygromyxa salina]
MPSRLSSRCRGSRVRSVLGGLASGWLRASSARGDPAPPGGRAALADLPRARRASRRSRPLRLSPLWPVAGRGLVLQAPGILPVVLDGVYISEADGQLRFHALPKPTPEQVSEVARWTYEAIARVLARHGRTLDGFADEQPALASCYGASVSDRQLQGASPGEQTRKLVHPVRELFSPDEALAEVWPRSCGGAGPSSRPAWMRRGIAARCLRRRPTSMSSRPGWWLGVGRAS